MLSRRLNFSFGYFLPLLVGEPEMAELVARFTGQMAVRLGTLVYCTAGMVGQGTKCNCIDTGLPNVIVPDRRHRKRVGPTDAMTAQALADPF